MLSFLQLLFFAWSLVQYCIYFNIFDLCYINTSQRICNVIFFTPWCTQNSNFLRYILFRVKLDDWLFNQNKYDRGRGSFLITNFLPLCMIWSVVLPKKLHLILLYCSFLLSPLVKNLDPEGWCWINNFVRNAVKLRTKLFRMKNKSEKTLLGSLNEKHAKWRFEFEVVLSVNLKDLC